MFVSFLMVATIIVAIALTALVLIQGQTAGLGTMFGGNDIYRTRRGIEKTMFNLTFILMIVFFLLCLITVAVE